MSGLNKPNGVGRCGWGVQLGRRSLPGKPRGRPGPPGSIATGWRRGYSKVGFSLALALMIIELRPRAPHAVIAARRQPRFADTGLYRLDSGRTTPIGTRERRRRLGLVDSAEDRAAGLAASVAVLIGEYLEVLAGRDTSSGYRALVDDYLTLIATGCTWFTFQVLAADGLIVYLGRRRDLHKNGPATLNSYMRIAKGFANWYSAKIGLRSPLSGLKPFPEEVDRRRSRRILTDAELSKLIEATVAALERAERWSEGRRGRGSIESRPTRACEPENLPSLRRFPSTSTPLLQPPRLPRATARGNARSRSHSLLSLLHNSAPGSPGSLQARPCGSGSGPSKRHQVQWLARDLARWRR